MKSLKWMKPHRVGVTTRAGERGGSSGEYLAGVFGAGEGTGEVVEPVEYIVGAVVFVRYKLAPCTNAIHHCSGKSHGRVFIEMPSSHQAVP
jgi:hypothetical protein